MSWLVANTVVATGFAVLVLVIGRLLRPAPAVMHGLWLCVLLKLVTPPLFEVPVPELWSGDPPPVAARTTAETRPGPTERELPAVAATTPQATPTPVAARPVGSAPADLAPVRRGTALLAAWASGATLLVLLAAFGAARARRRLRSLAPVRGRLRAEVDELARRLGVPVPDLRDDPAAAAPYVWTLGRTRLVLPAKLLLGCPAGGRAAVLAHELAHLLRRDHHIARLELVLLVLLWWHPLFWFARSRLRLWAELACDAVALRTVPGATLDYATVLVDAAARPVVLAPGPAVLAARPAARAAFERRLTMILNENFSRRASRAWSVPFAALALGLFAVPVPSQGTEREPVRIEIRINGEPVEGLTPAQRRALAEVLLQGKAGEPEAQEPAPPRRRAADRRRAPEPSPKLDGLPSGGELRALIGQGLAEARREIADDEDLRELGITDEVLQLLDGIERGEGVEGSIDGVVKAAMKGAGKLAIREIENDPDLKKLGIAGGLAELITGFLEDERNQELIGALARKALDSAVAEAKREIRGDADLRRLGIDGDVEKLIDSVIRGGTDFDGDLERLIEKAMKGAMREVERELGDEPGNEPPVEPARRGARKSRIR